MNGKQSQTNRYTNTEQCENLNSYQNSSVHKVKQQTNPFNTEHTSNYSHREVWESWSPSLKCIDSFPSLKLVTTNNVWMSNRSSQETSTIHGIWDQTSVFKEWSRCAAAMNPRDKRRRTTMHHRLVQCSKTMLPMPCCTIRCSWLQGHMMPPSSPPSLLTTEYALRSCSVLEICTLRHD